jgi:hypothetical protein
MKGGLMNLYTNMLLSKKSGKPPVAYTSISVRFLKRKWNVRPKYRELVDKYLASFGYNNFDVTIYPPSWREYEEKINMVSQSDEKNQAPWLTEVRGYGIPVSRTKEMQDAIDKVDGLKSYK